MYIYSYNSNSNAAKSLKDAMGIRKIRNENSRFTGSPTKVVINYGSSNLPEEVLKCRVVNNPQSVGNASNKLSFFRSMSDDTATDKPRIPEWTSNLETVRGWVSSGHMVMARTRLNGHSGEGIVVLSADSPATTNVDNCQLFTKYVKKKDEYRVHIVNGEIIDFARKALRNGEEATPSKFIIRNHDNGFVYVREGVVLPDDVRVQALRAMVLSRLDFGAVDVIYNRSQDNAYVLEINSAPGLEGSTITNYATALEAYRNAS